MKKLPKNWVETELGSILSLKNGYAFKTSDYVEAGIPIVRISNIQDGKIDLKKSISVKESLFKDDFIIQKGDILIAMSGATTGKYGVYDEEVITLQNQRVGNLKPYSNELSNKRYIYYLLGSLKKEIEDRAYGGAQPNISPKLIESIFINLPPLPEQNRIVEKLDNLFNQLETIKTSMANIPLLLRDFRQQVLSQAVTGKLTEEWRKGKDLGVISLSDEENKIELYHSKISDLIPSSWKILKMESVSKKITDGEHLTPKRTEKGEMLLSAKNVRDGYISYSDFDNISKEDFEKCLKRCKAEIGDILIVSVGATIGRTAIVEENQSFALVRSVALIKPSNLISSKFLMYILQSEYLQEVIEKASRGSAQSCLYINKIAGLPLPYTVLDEQQEIVSRVESLFAKADAIEQQYKTLKQKIDTLPQALLHKAFKGELTEQLDNDGDARELLQQIQELKNSTTKPKKVTTKKVKNYPENEEVLGMVAEK